MDKVEVKVFWFDIHLDHCMGEGMGEDLRSRHTRIALFIDLDN